MPCPPPMYFRISAGRLIVPMITKAHKTSEKRLTEGPRPDTAWSCERARNGPIVTFTVTLCVPCLRRNHWRHAVGRYLRSSVLGVHVQTMLPAPVIGESTRYLLGSLICLLAFGP